MYASADWMNEYLDPPATPQEQADLLTRAGFPLEGQLELGSDVRQDFEMTSNRGDCVCHVGLAREIAAISGRRLRPPRVSLRASGPPASKLVKVSNREPKLCPLYTARVIRGVRVRPSPEWLAARLQAIGQIPRNNIVDASNFVLFELGQPTHVFDLAKLKGHRIVVRRAAAGARFLPIGEGAVPVTLTGDDLVIADSERAVAIAGVMGGAESAVTESTTDILIEAATFDPVAVRDAGRRHRIESDSGFRFERGVPAGQVDGAAERLAQLILEHAGGELAEGSVCDGLPIPPPRRVTMRARRCNDLLGVEIPVEQMMQWLERLGFAPALDDPEGTVIRCIVPVHRLDIEREVDLIEEVGRMMGHDNLAVADTIEVRVPPLQATEMARRAVSQELVAMGFVEAITHSLIGEQAAEPFLEKGTATLRVEDPGTRHERVLRPSLLPSLLRVRAGNRDAGVKRLAVFESASTFCVRGGRVDEEPRVTLLADLESPDEGLRPLRGAVDRLVELLLGPGTRAEVVPDGSASWLDPGARVRVGGEDLGRLGLIEPSVRRLFGLEEALAAAELSLPRLYGRFPPAIEARALPSFPAVERDVSAVLDEQVSWARVNDVLEELGLEDLEAVEFVSSFRGRQVGAGRKSVLIRLRFRAADRTLRSEAVDAQVASAMAALERRLGAAIRR